MPNNQLFQSSLGIKYPKLRDHPLHTGYTWLKDKRADDDTEGLWRIHDKLYDFTRFIEKHPGGRDWIQLTRGTDITEAFEVHHINEELAVQLLPKYYVRSTQQTRRNSPFTFHENDFYCTLKRNVRDALKTIPHHQVTGAIRRSKCITDTLLASYLSTALLAVYWHSFIVGLVSGIFLSLTAIAAHNYFHQRDNFRRHYFAFTMMQSKEWRISHALSHHLYTNTINDLEISSLEPFLEYLPKPDKTFLVRYGSWIYAYGLFVFLFFGHYIKTTLQTILASRRNIMDYNFELVLPFLVPVLMILFSGQSMSCCLWMFVWIEACGSLHFGIVGVNAAHHHPEIFHDGDPLSRGGGSADAITMDWGVYQLSAVMDRKDITGSHFLVLTNFGDHSLHHLFPTIDHGLLTFLYPVFLATCRDFGVEWRLSTQFELVKGQHRQLARNKIAMTL